MANKIQKLELTWPGKDERLNPEPRILVEDESKSHAVPVAEKDGLFEDENAVKPTFDNMLIHGDNLLALKALEQDFAGKVKCIYIDPPYNTGNAFEHYDDGLEHSIWLSLMRDRLEILKNLLSDNGSIWIQIDDEEQAYLKVLCDEIFGRQNFVNMISINMKNIAGASGGGEDKRLKKNCEFVLVYAKDYEKLPVFKGAYDYEEISKLVERYKNEGISWKYTSVLYEKGEKNFIGTALDGDGNDIKIYERRNAIIKSVSQVAKQENLTEAEVYQKFAKNIFQTAMPQSSIRPRVMKAVKEIGTNCDVFSIEYTPKTGRNKGVLYEQFYKGENFRLFAWLSDVSVEFEQKLYKKTLQGTYWDYTAGTKNLTKEGTVEFPNGKKPEALISRILEMATERGDLVLDSFLGSGTTAAVAHKMGRRWIGIEMGDHVYTHCLPRLTKVINGEDAGGITKSVNWKKGGGFKFYELASSLIEEDALGQAVISDKYNAEMLAEAMCKLMGYHYAPDKNLYWKQGYSSEQSFIYTTTQNVQTKTLDALSQAVGNGNLLICCGSLIGDKKAYPNITIKKIPAAVLKKCEYGKPGYPLPVREDFTDEDFEFGEEE